MTDTEKNTETKVAAKPNSKTRTKAAAKPKAAAKAKSKTRPKAKDKPKAEAKSKTKAADTTPYLKKDSKTRSSQAESPNNKSSVSLALLLAAVIIIPTTIYKFNEELSNLSAQTEFQKNTINTKTASTEMMQTNIDNNNTEIKSAKTPEPAANNNEMIQQRRQAYEKEIQSRRQKYQEMMAARQQEMAKAAEEQKEKLQRIRQNQLETRLKVQEMQEQIFELHEKIHQLMQERYTRHRP